MDARAFESDDEPPDQIYGTVRSGSGAEPETSDVQVEAVASSSDTTTLRTSLARSTPFDTELGSIFSSHAALASRPKSPSSAPLRLVQSPFPSLGPLATIASASSPSTPRRSARFLSGDISILRDAALPAAEKDGDDPSTPVQSEAPREGDYKTPTRLTRLLASHVDESPGASRSHSYISGNANLVQQGIIY